MIRYLHVLSEFVNTPWAIQEEKLRVMEALVMLQAQGGKLSDEEMQARIGAGAEKRQPRTQKSVAILPVHGVISNRMNMFSDFSGGTSIEKLTSQFRSALDDGSIDAIVLDIDSPGGSVFGVQELADEIYAARGKKKIVAQVNPLAASAAYWLAAAASEIAIVPSGQAGSIGVFTTHKDISQMLANEGIKVTLVGAGKYKTEANQFEPLSDEAQAYLKKMVDDYYAAFTAGVARGRGVSQANVKSGFGEGRVVSAQDAVAMGMADRVATLDQTVEGLLGGKPTNTSTVALAEDGTISRVPVTVGTQASSEAQAAENPASAENTMEAHMSTTATPAAAAADLSAIRENAITAETQRVNAITTLARSAGMSDKAAGWIRESKSVEAVLSEINESLAKGAKAVRTAEPGNQVELTDREQKSYSLMRGIRAMCGWEAKGFEHEVSATIAKKLGRDTNGFFMPTNLKMSYRDGQLTSEQLMQQFNAVLQGTSGQQPGTNLVQTSILPSEFIELLRNAMVCMRMGARKLGDLQGNIQLPKQTAAATLYWTGENPGSAVTPSDQTFSNIQATPHQAMAQTAYSRQFLIQSSPDAEQLIREDLAAIFAIGLDLAALTGSGSSNQPKGITNQTGVNQLWCNGTSAGTSNGGAITNALITQMLELMEESNIPMIREGFVTTPGVKQALKNKAILSNTINLPIWSKDNTVDGAPAFSSNQLPSNATFGTGTNLHTAIRGDFWQLIFADWGAMEIIADPYTQAGKGNVVLTGMMLVDIIVRYAQAFTVIADINKTA